WKITPPSAQDDGAARPSSSTARDGRGGRARRQGRAMGHGVSACPRCTAWPRTTARLPWQRTRRRACLPGPRRVAAPGAVPWYSPRARLRAAGGAIPENAADPGGLLGGHPRGARHDLVDGGVGGGAVELSGIGAGVMTGVGGVAGADGALLSTQGHA